MDDLIRDLFMNIAFGAMDRGIQFSLSHENEQSNGDVFGGAFSKTKTDFNGLKFSTFPPNDKPDPVEDEEEDDETDDDS